MSKRLSSKKTSSFIGAENLKKHLLYNILQGLHTQFMNKMVQNIWSKTYFNLLFFKNTLMEYGRTLHITYYVNLT